MSRYSNHAFVVSHQAIFFAKPAIAVVVENIAISAVGLGSVPRLVKSDAVLLTAHYRCYVSLELCCPSIKRGDGSRHS